MILNSSDSNDEEASSEHILQGRRKKYYFEDYECCTSNPTQIGKYMTKIITANQHLFKNFSPVNIVIAKVYFFCIQKYVPDLQIFLLSNLSMIIQLIIVIHAILILFHIIYFIISYTYSLIQNSWTWIYRYFHTCIKLFKMEKRCGLWNS